ncbi:MAG: hypothetical protein QOE46_1436 [Acidobacteriota bacterium]|jgi:hypothetical protein|nr:hypothetical protein [Acidobacteriota bacterium]
MRLKTLMLMLCALLLACVACVRKEGDELTTQPTPVASTPQQATTQPTPSATCRLLTASDLRELQGEEPLDAQGSEHLAGTLATSQCFYRMPTFVKSVNLEVTRAAPGATADAVKKFWRERFNPDAFEARERERERKEEGERKREDELKRERASGQVTEGGHSEKEKGEGVEESRPRRVAGIGNEAFWSESQSDGALFVLMKDVVVRIGIGGMENEGAKIKKATGLARKVLKQL